MKILKRFLPILLILVMFVNTTSADAASKVKINKTKATVYVGKTTTLKISGTKSTVKWATKSKKIATVSKKGKVTGKKAGKTTITATVGGKSYKCTVTVKKAKVVKVVEVTPEDNVKTLVAYINKNGFDAPITEYKMIRWESKYGEPTGESIKLLSDNIIEFSSTANLDLIPKGYYGNLKFTINIDDLKTISIKEGRMLLDGKAYPFPDNEINMTDLVKKNDMKFNDELINEEMNNVFDIILDRLNTFMIEETKLGLKDIGFTNYK